MTEGPDDDPAADPRAAAGPSPGRAFPSPRPHHRAAGHARGRRPRARRAWRGGATRPRGPRPAAGARCGCGSSLRRLCVNAVTAEAAAFERTHPQVDTGLRQRRRHAPESVDDVGADLLRAASSGRDPGMDVWIPESSTWAKVLSRRPEVDRLLPDVFSIIAFSPVVAAMPEPMAKAVGWPDRVVELDDLVAVAQDPAGWARFGHPEWGRVRVGWQSPQDSSAGLDGLMTLFARLDSDSASPDQLRGGMLRVQNALSTLDVDRQEGVRQPERPHPVEQRRAAWFDDHALDRARGARLQRRQPDGAARRRPRGRERVVVQGGLPAAVRHLARPGAGHDGRRHVPGLPPDAGRRPRLRRRTAGACPGAAAGTPTGPATVGAGASARQVPVPRLELSQPSLQSINRALQSWSALERRGSVLLVVDVSGSMKQQVPKLGLSRLQLAQQALTLGRDVVLRPVVARPLAVLAPLDGAKDYRVVVPLGGSADAVGARRAARPCCTVSRRSARRWRHRPVRHGPRRRARDAARSGSPTPTSWCCSATARTTTPEACRCSSWSRR